MMSKPNFLSATRINLWGRFSRRSFSTAQKIEYASNLKTPITEIECEVHNSKVPTYKQIKKSPELQKRLAEMYKSQAEDPDFQQITIESMKWGVRSLGKEKP